DVDGADDCRRTIAGRNGQRLAGHARGKLVDARLELPTPVATDQYADDVVAFGIQCVAHRARRRQRDLVLARPPTREECHSQAAGQRQGVVVAAAVVVALQPVDSHRPTTSVTLEPGFACVPPSGRSSSTIWSWLGSLTGWYVNFTLKPSPCSVWLAEATSRFRTSGTATVFGP